jgi:hypothetical protein
VIGTPGVCVCDATKDVPAFISSCLLGVTQHLLASVHVEWMNGPTRNEHKQLLNVQGSLEKELSAGGESATGL